MIYRKISFRPERIPKFKVATESKSIPKISLMPMAYENLIENAESGKIEKFVVVRILLPHLHHHREARYVPLDIVYSATSPCSGYSTVMSKKVKARKFPALEDHYEAVSVDLKPKPLVIHFYTRTRRRKRTGSFHGCSGYDTFLANLKAVSVV
ncbi:hypothetical protein L1987_18124 [Smallanthus sonchifolius]|uniref:Uncharacterized protein n=1 Tax=Smallanthus sonchifolius TaxID=185202 RepID=A0ACB9J2B7_9ASTR|nr:hypothetical protein L1987_18124 [Smallanthus sonchifolius]